MPIEKDTGIATMNLPPPTNTGHHETATYLLNPVLTLPELIDNAITNSVPSPSRADTDRAIETSHRHHSRGRMSIGRTSDNVSPSRTPPMTEHAAYHRPLNLALMPSEATINSMSMTPLLDNPAT